MQLDSAKPTGDLAAADQRVVTYNVPWSHYEVQLALRGESSVPRLSYLDGVLEIVTPSREHERLESFLGRLLEAYALERDIDLSPYGSWTLKQAPKAAGLEPDECYLVGDQAKEVPDLAIEVALTTGGLDKLEIYRRLGVGEVWIWVEGRLRVHALESEAYEECERSALFPDLDLEQLVSFLDRPTALQAVKGFLAELRE